MTSAVKSFLVLLLTLPLLIYIGSEIGSDEYLAPIIVGVLMVLCLIFGLFFRSQRVECIILLLLVGGYIIGNRGFAQIYLVQPLFVGEVGMLVILVAMVFRFVVSREFIVAPHLITRLVGFYLFMAVVRLCFDWRVYTIDAARDSAIVYYAVFFFIAYQLGRHADIADFLDRAIIKTFFVLAVVAVVAIFEPEWLDLVTIRGLSPLYQKLDITATFCSLGILFILIRADLVRSRWAGLAAILMLVVSMSLTGSRAALVALGGALTLTWVAGRRGFLALPMVFGALAVAAVLVFGADSTGRLASTRDQLISIVDVSGSYSYQSDLGEEKQADNRFRRALWDSIYRQTVQDNAWFLGKGFGYNFIPAFEDEYRAGSWDTLRSAHNYYYTVFGRLGLLGFGTFVAITIVMVQYSLRTALALRRGERHDSQSLAYWCGAWAILISGSFGVVLEGPMGAIPFWSFMGLALASDDRKRIAAKAEETEALVFETPRGRPMPRPALAH